MTGAVVIVVAVVLAVMLPSERRDHDAPQVSWQQRYRSVFARRSPSGTIFSSLLTSLCWQTWTTYIVVFLAVTYQLSTAIAATYVLVNGVGVVLGSSLAGRFGDRWGHRSIAAWTVLGAGLMIVVLTNVPVPLVASAFVSLCAATFMGMRFTSWSTLASEQVPLARGTLLGLTQSVQSFGLVLSAYVGGRLVDGPGFSAMGVFCAVAATAAAVTMYALVEEHPSEVRVVSSA